MGEPAAKMAKGEHAVKLFTGAEMPLVGLGTWKSKPGEVAAAVKSALEMGYRHIDCAACYGNETEVGQGLKAAFDSGVPRESVFVTSKLWNSKHDPQDVEAACRKTLSDLGLEYLDLYLIHWPHGFAPGDDPFPKNEDGTIRYSYFPLEDTWKAMEKLVAAGLCKHIGVSNFNSKQIERMFACATVKPAVLQIEAHPYFQQKQLIPFAQSKGLVVTAYSPLASPDRPWGKPEEPTLLEDPVLQQIAAKHNKSPAQICIRWQIERGIVVIPKSVTPSRIASNRDVFSFSLDKEDLAAIEGIDRKWRACLPLIKKADGSEVARDAGHPEFPFNEPF